MTITEDAIENLADSFCLIGKPEHRQLYVEGLKAIARMARSELVLTMEIDFQRATKPQHN